MGYEAGTVRVHGRLQGLLCKGGFCGVFISFALALALLISLSMPVAAFASEPLSARASYESLSSTGEDVSPSDLAPIEDEILGDEVPLGQRQAFGASAAQGVGDEFVSIRGYATFDYVAMIFEASLAACAVVVLGAVCYQLRKRRKRLRDYSSAKRK